MVKVVSARRGALPRTVVAYGTVAPASNGTVTFSEAQPGQIAGLAVSPGMAVRRGQNLATFVTAPASRSSYQQAVSALDTARKQRATTAQLVSQQLATQDQLTQAQKALADAQSALAALQADGAGRSVHTIAAPFDGIVTGVAVAPGDRTQAGAPILTLARAGAIVVTVGIDPDERAGVVAGQGASLQRLAGGPTLHGKVIRVDGVLNATTRLVDVDLGFPAGALLSGEAMRVGIETGQVHGWLVPHPAVVTAGGTPRVFQIVDGKAKAIPVAVTLASDQGDVVQGPLDATKPVIVEGAYQVSDGDAVRRSH
jgi:RND family efflux transporter MFP subunit